MYYSNLFVFVVNVVGTWLSSFLLNVERHRI